MSDRIDTKAILASAGAYEGAVGADWVVRSIVNDVNGLRRALAQEIAEHEAAQARIEALEKALRDIGGHGADIEDAHIVRLANAALVGPPK